MSADVARATLNLPRELHGSIGEWAIDAAAVLRRPVSFQDAARAILAAGVSDPAAGEAALDQLRDARQLWASQQEAGQ